MMSQRLFYFLLCDVSLKVVCFNVYKACLLIIG